ncbi:flagellar hook-length control protein FliK [Rhodopseudomonas parapalustris]
MAISVNPNLPLVALQGATADVLLQPGAVLQAKVLSVLDNNQVRIAIGGQTVEATTQVPLQAGQTLQVSVSQTDAGIRLAIVNQPVTTTTAQAALAASGPAVDSVTLGPQAIVVTSAQAAPSIVPAATPALTPQQAAAVATAAQTAVTHQTGLSALFANLGAVAGSSALPAAVREAAAQVLAQQLPTAGGLSGADIQKAVQSSGIFLEAALAAGRPAAAGGADLKAALLVLRQVLSTALGAATVQAGGATTTPVLQNGQGTALLALTAQLEAEANLLGKTGQTTPGQATTGQASEPTAANGATTALPFTASPTLASAAAATAAASASTSEQSLVQNVIAQLTGTATSAQAETAASRNVATLSALQQALQADPRTAAILLKAGLNNPVLLSLLPALTGTRVVKDDSGIARTNTPPPPFPGALPAAQPVMPANLNPHAPLDANLRRILTETEGALARQTLLQVASLPDRADAAAARLDAAQPRWSFEIPLATPQGTAVAQFEISRDRDEAAQAGAAAGTVWQARFSLDVEPAGPVHALISLRGEKTSVRLWAERPATTAQLRADAADLGQALARADLVPGDIVVRDGTPPAPRPAAAGHFLDRAL